MNKKLENQLVAFAKGKTFSNNPRIYVLAKQNGITREHAATTRARENAKKMAPLWNDTTIPAEKIAKRFGISRANLYVRAQKYRELFPEVGLISRWGFAPRRGIEIEY